MASFVFTNPKVSINSVDLSAWTRSVSIDYSAEVVDSTTAGSTTKTKLGGLKDWTATVEFAQDYAASAPDVSLFSIVGTSVAVSIVPVNTTVSATNPNYNGNAIVSAYKPAGGSIGGLAITNVTLAGNGTLTRSTSP